MKRILFLLTLALLATTSLVAQDITVRGNVKSSDENLPIIGATVMVAGTQHGETTDRNGNFTISVKPNATLTISYLGYEEQNIAVANRSSLEIVLEPETNVFDEVVIIGYGAVKKSDLTGAVASLKGDELKKNPVANVAEALQGKIAGVTVASNTGQPGSDVSVRIRGIGSVNAGVTPLYVVDGMIVDNINFLSPNDIASTEVLKDASSAAIYGSRAANGVILVTTKSGSNKQHTNITFEAYAGVQSRWNKLDLMSATEQIETMFKINNMSRKETEAYQNGGLNGWLNYARIGGLADYPIAGTAEGNFDYASNNTDWQDAVFRAAPIQNYYVSVDSGNEKMKQTFSANYFSQDGTIIGSYYDRINLRYNSSSQLKKWLRIGETFNFSTVTSRWALNNNSQPGASILSAALAMAPWDPTHYPAGTRNHLGDDLSNRISAASNFQNVVNPFSMATHSHPRGGEERYVGSLYADITPTKHLTLRSDVSFDMNYNRYRSFSDEYHYSNADKNDANSIGQSMSRSRKVIVNNYGTYAREIGKHNLSLMVGHTLEMASNESVGVGGRNLLNTDERFWSLGYATSDFTYGGSYYGEYRRMSFIGRAQYGYDDRYLLTFNWRSDGNRAFQGSPWGHFPSVAGAWKISEEEFLEDNENISLLKLRLGWGRLGNDNVDSNLFTMTMDSSMYANLGYPFGPSNGDFQELVTGAAVTSQKNLAGRWEITEHYNLGIDYGFFDDRLTGSVDLFIRDTKDMLLARKWPNYAGVLYTAVDNIGTMRNKGVEFQVAWQDNFMLGSRPFSYQISGNMSFVENLLVDMNGADRVWGDKTVTDQGYAVGSFWGYQYDGIFRSEEEINEFFRIIPNPQTQEEIDYNATRNIHNFEVGDVRYKDLNDDGELDDEEDMCVIGNPFPKFTYGLNLSLDWAGFDMQLFFQGVYGNTIYNALRERIEGNGLQSQLSTAMRDAWTEENPMGSLPNPNHTVNFYQSDRFLEDGSYLRLKNLQLGYTLPRNLSEKLQISSLRIYVSAQNLLTFTSYSGYDPEVGGGVDYGNYPQSRTYMLGVNLSF